MNENAKSEEYSAISDNSVSVGRIAQAGTSVLTKPIDVIRNLSSL